MIRKKRSQGNGKRLSVYSNLSAKRHAKKDARSRKKAEYLASLPKNPFLRTVHRLHPRRVIKYWFSRDGLLMGLKIFGVATLFAVLAFGALFAYYRRELDSIRPSELAKRVQTTVTKYYDRNGVLLWEDKGAGNYRLVVPSDDISPYMKKATVAIEDKDFYKHGGVSVTGITRAFVNNFTDKGSTQGGSTLTQQLVKQVFFADESQNRGLGGVPRKIKEAILAVEVERMYNKDQILNLYLNESPYGGRRNGVESAAQTYFGKSAKDLTLAEAAVLASIPQNPSTFDPYNTAGHDALLRRQKTVLNYMAEQGYVTKKEAEDAKKVAVLDTIKPETDQYQNIKAPHFVQYVRSQLEKELGKATVGRGGLTVKTTLDYRVQQTVEGAMTSLFNSYLPKSANFDNGAATIVDNQTGQVLALQGSRDYNFPGYGQDNAAISYIQPGSSIKPFVYAGLFQQKPSGQQYGTGSILKDEPIDQIYGAKLENFDHKYLGNLTIRQGLAQSRNVPAVKAMYITGQAQTIQGIHDMGDKSYCTDGVDSQVGLASAIGGCGLKQIEHANTFATLARGGVYKPVATILEVKNSQNQTIKEWKDEPKQVLDPQVPYLLESILSDDNARAPSFGRGASGLNVPGVKTFTKTGTSNLGEKSKDLWMNSVSTKVALSIWVGNHDTQPMSNALSSIVGPTVNKIMEPIHKDIFAAEGTWKTGDWFTQPAGIQNIRGELFPSWYNQKQAQTTTQVTFDKVSKKKATSCTPEQAKVNVNTIQSQDPVTKKTTITAEDGYDASADDDTHKCEDVKPFATDATATKTQVTVNVSQGTHPLQTVQVSVDGTSIGEQPASATGQYTFNAGLSAGAHTVVVNITDAALYQGSFTKTVTIDNTTP